MKILDSKSRPSFLLPAHPDIVTSTAGAGAPSALRTIHYLGSKFRLLQPIRDAVADVVQPRATVCDIFAGSGAVSLFLGSTWNLVAADIQEYSRVICNGLLNPPQSASERSGIGHALIERAQTSDLRHKLLNSLAKLIDFEQDSYIHAARGEFEDLCHIMECPPLISPPSEIQYGTRLDSLWRSSQKRLALNGLDKVSDSVVTRHFGGVYFSWSQAIDIDSLLAEIHRMESCKDYYLAALLATVSNTVNTVGKHFAQPAKPRAANGSVKHHLIRRAIRDRTIDVFADLSTSLGKFNMAHRGELSHRVIRRDYVDILSDHSIKFDALYADPPYTRDHYSRYYHVLETMARHDNPSVTRTLIRGGGKPRLSRGVYRMDRHQSPFCIQSKAPAAFKALFKGAVVRNIPLVLSYSPYSEKAGHRPRMLKVEFLMEMLKDFFSQVDMKEIDNVSHNKFNLSEKNIRVADTAEVLFLCRP